MSEQSVLNLVKAEIDAVPMRGGELEAVLRRANRRRLRYRAVALSGVLAAGALVVGTVSLLRPAAEPVASDQALELVPGLTIAPGDPRSAFLGTWVTTDLDGSTPTMVIQVSGEGVEVRVHDAFALVCSGAPSTMTGTGQLQGDTELVFPAPVLTCDDESEPAAVSGPPLAEQLQNLTFVQGPQTDTLTDNSGSLWVREGAEDPSPVAATGWWPQTSLEEVRHAQERANAGDPDFTWQVEPIMAESFGSAEVFGRLLREQLGWEEFIVNPFSGGDYGEGTLSGVMYLRCAPDSTNPLYPNDRLGGGCAPTIDEFRYETVEIDVAQPGRRDPTGIWVVTAWRTVESFQQMTPPSDSEITALFVPFLQARIDGEGAEDHLDETVPLLYGTTTGAPYENFEFEPLDDPEWPNSGRSFKVRLFAQDGNTVVEQLFRIDRDAPGPLDLGYSLNDGSTTENGQPVSELPQPYEFLGGEVTFGAVPSWGYSWAGWHFSPTMTTLLLNTEHEERLVLLADPQPIETGCVKAPVPIDANALALSLRSDPDLEVTEPVPARIAGMEGLQMDVVLATSGNLCEESGVTEVVAGADLQPGQRMRLYLIDYPGGSAQVLAIAIVAPEDRFESVLEEATPIVESIEFQAR